MKKEQMNWILSFLILMSGASSVHAEEHGLYTAILKDYVKGHSVNYKDLSKDKRLAEYVEQLSRTDPEALSSREAKFAFWLNVYNAYSLKVIADHYPIKSIDQLNFGGLVVSVMLKKTVWDKPLVIVNGKKLTLRSIDHEILRPQFQDSRIQFAIICGAVSCAPPMTEAFEADKLEGQLEAQSKSFFNDRRLNSFDVKNKIATLSILLKASMKEFGANEQDLLRYASKFLPEDEASLLKEHLSSWKIKYNSYDLTINDTAWDSK